MKDRCLPSRRTTRQWAAVTRQLAVPVPFELTEFRARMQRHTQRVVELIPAVMREGAPSGIWLRTASADYFYYEEQTSPFHQAHIVLFLAAYVLLGGTSGASVDPRLVPDVSPALARIMIDGNADSPLTRPEAETFAFLALEHARPAAYPPSLARRALRQLQPLHSALREAVPEATGAVACRFWPAASFRLHRQVIQIRDAALALRPHRDPQVAAVATRAARAAGLSGSDLAAAVEASVLSAAMHARTAGDPMRNVAGHAGLSPVAGPDLRSETACLVKIARAFAQLQHDEDPAHGKAPRNRPDGPVRPAPANHAPFR
jgi:hypothetical protein